MARLVCSNFANLLRVLKCQSLTDMKILRKLRGRSRPRLDARSRKRRSLFESLERRLLLAAVSFIAENSSSLDAAVPAVFITGAAAPIANDDTFSIDEDGTRDLIDFAAFRAAFGRSSSDPDFDPEFDIDGNGKINLGDFAAFRKTLSDFELDVLANDVANSDHPLTIVSVAQGDRGGVVTIVDGATIRYRPAADYFGEERFSYTVADGADGTEAVAWVTVQVSGTADIVADSARTSRRLPVDVNVLENDDFEATPRVTRVTQGAGGSVTINPDGTVRYTPANNYTGTDTFEYTVTSGGVNETAAVTITVDQAAMAHFSFDEGSGTTVSGGAVSGTVHDANWVTGYDGQSLQFDGDQSYVDLDAIDLPSNASGLTLAAWIKIDDTGSIDDRRIISKATGTAENDHYWMLSTIDVGRNSRLRFRLKTGSNPAKGTTTLIANAGDLQSGTWYHAAATYDGSEMKLYLDGRLVGRTAKSGAVATSGGVEAYIGANPSGGKHWQGLIDEVRIDDRALSAGEIGELAAEIVDTVPSKIGDIRLSDVTSTQATLTWTSDEPVTARVEYGTSPTLGQSSPSRPCTRHRPPGDAYQPNTQHDLLLPDQRHR